MDKKPTYEELERQVENLHKKNRKNESDLCRMQALVKNGNWIWDLTQQTLKWSDETFSLFGLESSDYKPSTELFQSMMHPDAREYFLRQSELILTKEELRRLNRILKTLSACSKALIHATDESELLNEICRIIVEKGRYRLAWVGFVEHDEKKTVRPVAQSGYEEGYLDTVNITWADTRQGLGPTGRAIRTGKPCVVNNIMTNSAYTPWRAAAIRRGYASSFSIPLSANEQIFGTLNIYAEFPDAFDWEERKLLTELADDLAYGITALRTLAERNAAHKALKHNQRLLTETERLGKVGGWEFNIDTLKQTWTEEVYRIHEMDPAYKMDPAHEITVEKGINFYTTASRRIIERACLRAIEHGEPFNVELEIITAKGNLRSVHAIGKPDPERRSVHGFFQDVTERKVVEKELNRYRDHLEEIVRIRTIELETKSVELEKANIRLQDANRLKNVFLASMSHELRTPLNSIIGFTGLLLMEIAGNLNEEQKKQLVMVEESAHHLLELINDVLDISSIEAGKLQLNIKDFQFDDILKEVVESFSMPVTEKGLDLSVEISGKIRFSSDRRRLKQVLINLVNNAIKFTDKGSINITGRLLNEDVVELRVIDTGTGIKKEDISKLFRPFQQVDTNLIKQREGTGLGLYLTRKLLDLLKGTIQVKSEYGTGTEFKVVLPLKLTKEPGNENNTGH